MSILRSLEIRAMERRGADPLQPWGDSTPPTNAMLGLSAAGVLMNDDAALSITTVGTCISLLADGIATLPIGAWKDTPDNTKKPISPTPALVKNPWPLGTRIDFFTQVMHSLLLRGNFYGLIVDRDSGGYAAMIMPIHPDRVSVRRDRYSGDAVYRIDSKVVRTLDVVHIKTAQLPPGALQSLNPVEYMRTSWSLAKASAEFGANFFANSASPGGVIQVPGDLNPDETLAMARAWTQGHQGVGKAQLPAVLTDGAEWKQISLSPDDAQFLLTRTFEQQQIISWFRIPPHKIGVQDRSPGPVLTEELEMQYVMEGLQPWAERIEATFNELLRPSQVMRFDFSNRLRGNSLMRWQSHQISLNTGAEMIDEVRGKEDLEPLPNGLGQVIARPANMSYWDTTTGKQIASPSAPVSPVNPGGVGDGGGDPGNSPSPTAPDGSGSK